MIRAVLMSIPQNEEPALALMGCHQAGAQGQLRRPFSTGCNDWRKAGQSAGYREGVSQSHVGEDRVLRAHNRPKSRVQDVQKEDAFRRRGEGSECRQLSGMLLAASTNRPTGNRPFPNQRADDAQGNGKKKDIPGCPQCRIVHDVPPCWIVNLYVRKHHTRHLRRVLLRNFVRIRGCRGGNSLDVVARSIERKLLAGHGRRKNNTNRDEVTTSCAKPFHRLQWLGRNVLRYRMRANRTGARSHRIPFNRKNEKLATPTRDHQANDCAARGWLELIESRMVPTPL